MQQEVDRQEADLNELQGAAALIPLPATPRQELQNDLQLANRMQELQDSVERGPQFFTPQEQQKQGPVLRERKNQTVSKQLTYNTNIIPEQTGTIPTVKSGNVGNGVWFGNGTSIHIIPTGYLIN
jgi:hypothetical protein